MDDYRFAESLKDMSVFELSHWLKNCLASVYRLAPGGNGVYEIDGAALEALYNDFVELINLAEESAGSYGELAETLLANKKVLSSAQFKKTIVALHRPLPKVTLDVGKKMSVDITEEVYNQPMSIINALTAKEIDSGAQQYRDLINSALWGADLEYRKNLLDFIRTKKTERGHVEYKLPKHEKWFDGKDIDNIIKAIADTKRKSAGPYTLEKSERICIEEEYLDSQRKKGFDYAETLFGGLGELQNYSISYSMSGRYKKNSPVDKVFLIRLAFFLGTDVDLFENLLMKEGFSTSQSVRPNDIIVKNSFRIGFPFEFADKLLKIKGYAGIKLKPKP